MLFRIVAVFIFVLVLSSAIGIILTQRRARRDALDPKLIAKRRMLRRLTGTFFWVSLSAFLFLLTDYFSPVEILLALVFGLLIPSVAIVLSDVLSGANSQSREGISENQTVQDKNEEGARW